MRDDHSMIEVIGAPGSPYTQKIIAYLRFRRLAHQVHWGDAAATLKARDLPTTPVSLLPTVLVTDGDHTEVLIDSTPIIRRFEALHSSRRARPSLDPVLALIDALIEDYADEWCTKLMFHYRWHFEPDARFSAATLPLGIVPSLSDEEAQTFGTAFADRQIGRLRYVGSNDQTAPVIERAYQRLLEILANLLAKQRFILGAQPSACDFALYGQLTQLALYDPTPRAIAASSAPRVIAWVASMADMSGLNTSDDPWRAPETILPEARALLGEIGRVYAPLLLANDRAQKNSESTWTGTIDDSPWTQDTFKYQSRCLDTLKQEFSELGPSDQRRLINVLNGTGCEALFLTSA